MKNSRFSKGKDISRATIGRIPQYVQYLRSLPEDVVSISATRVASDLGLGEVQVRKDLGSVSGAGRPKIGYRKTELIAKLESFLSGTDTCVTVLVGAGKLGRALLDYTGFSDYGLEIRAAFDTAVSEVTYSGSGKPILPMQELERFCETERVSIGIIAVPAAAAQQACDRLVQNGVRAIWCFAPCKLDVPDTVRVSYENMALSLAHLKAQIQTNP